MRETPQAAAAFEAYYALGAERSLARLGRDLAKSLPLLKDWSMVHGWQQRVIDRDREAAAAVERDKQHQIASAKARLVKQGIAAQIKASRELERLADAKKLGAVAAVQWLTQGARMELRGLDQPESVTRNEQTGAGGGAIKTEQAHRHEFDFDGFARAFAGILDPASGDVAPADDPRQPVDTAPADQ